MGIEETESIQLYNFCAAVSYCLDSSDAFVSYAEIVLINTIFSYQLEKKSVS